MTVKDVSRLNGIKMVYGKPDKEILSVFCCDLLSFAMGRAPSGCAWVTVIGNVNAAAVALLTDVACIVLADGVEPDGQMLCKAQEHGITVMCSDMPVFETALAIKKGIIS